LQAVAKKLERNMLSDSLNQKLYHRQDVSALRAAGRLKAENVAPALRGTKIKLEHAITRDQVGHLLESRPEQAELVRAGVISNPVHGRIAGVQRKLQRQMMQDKVGHLLEKRGDLEQLHSAHILDAPTHVAPAISGVARQLQRNLNKANLFHALKHRPTVDELHERGITYVNPYEGDEVDEEDEEEAQQLPLRDQRQSQRRAAAGGAGPSVSVRREQAAEPAYQRRSKNFHLTRILLKFVANMAEAGEITLPQKGFLKDLIVDQDHQILAVAETFDAENDVTDFKESLLTLANRGKA